MSQQKLILTDADGVQHKPNQVAHINICMNHKHHIIPKHAGGDDNQDNIIELTVEEHAEAHRKLYEKYGRQEDYLAWKGLSGCVGKEEILLAKCSLNSSRPGESNPFYGRKHSEETKRKISEKKIGVSVGKGILKSEAHKKKLSEAKKKIAKKYSFIHTDGSTFIGTTTELGKHINSHPAEIWKLRVGRYKHVKGWKLDVKTNTN